MEEDQRLYKEFLNGNDSSFNIIVLKYKDGLIKFIQSYVKDEDTAEDLSQDVFVYVLKNRVEYDFKYSLKTYLFRIAMCRAINYINKRKREISIEEIDLENIEDVDENSKIENTLINKENIKQVEKAISKLKEEYRTVIYLKDFQDFSYKDICKIMNKSMPQVKVLLHRARAALKKNLEREEFIC